MALPGRFSQIQAEKGLQPRVYIDRTFDSSEEEEKKPTKDAPRKVYHRWPREGETRPQREGGYELPRHQEPPQVSVEPLHEEPAHYQVVHDRVMVRALPSTE